MPRSWSWQSAKAQNFELLPFLTSPIFLLLQAIPLLICNHSNKILCLPGRNSYLQYYHNLKHFHVATHFAVFPINNMSGNWFFRLIFDRLFILLKNCSKCRVWIFDILAFFTNFCLIEIYLSGTTVRPQVSGFQKITKMCYFDIFN